MDDLDSKTDAELNEVFAVEVAGWRKEQIRADGARHGEWALWPPNERQIGWPYGISPPKFATDANAVLPYLEKEQSFNVDRTHLADDDQLYRVSLRKREGIGLGPTFPRAACIALIRAKRSAK